MRTAAQALRAAGWLLLGALAAAGVALSVAYVVLSTDTGRGLVVPPALALLNREIAGRVELGGFKVLTTGVVELDGIRVFDPAGDEVLRLDRALLSADLSRLSTRTLGLRGEVRGLAVVLKREAGGGLSIARAFASRRARIEVPVAGDVLGWSVRVSRLELHDASLRFAEADGGPGYAARGLEAVARGRWGSRGGRVELRLSGEVVEPIERPLSLVLSASLRRQALAVPVLRAAVGETGLELVAEGDGATRRGRVAVLALGARGADLVRLVPGLPPLGDAAGTLYAESDGRVATAALEVRPVAGRSGSASGAAAVRLGPAPLAAGFELSTAALDPARLLSIAPPGAITLSARGRLRDLDPARLDGAVSVSVGPSRLRAGQLGPAELRASASGGAVDVPRLEVRLPGAACSGELHFRRGGPLAGRISADGSDLALLARNLGALLGRPLPELAGSAHVEAELSGTDRAPAARVDARSPFAAAGGASGWGIALHADVAGPVREARGRLDASLARLEAGGLEARELAVGASIAERQVEARLSTLLPRAGPDPFTLRAAGTLAEDLGSLSLASLDLAWPGSRFALAGPAQVTFAGPAVDRLELRSGPQALALEGGLQGGEVKLRLGLERIELSRLPAALLPLRLGGRLSLAAEVRGRLEAPAASAHVEWSEGVAGPVDALEAAGDLRWDASAARISGALGVRRAGTGEITLRGDVPASPARAGSAEPLRASVSLSGLDVAEALRLAGSRLPFAGLVSAEVAVGGTLGAPTLLASVEAREARPGEWGPFAVRARIEDPGEAARVDAQVDDEGGRILDAQASAPLDLAELLREPARLLATLAGAPLALAVSSPGIDLARYAGKGGLPADLAGRLALRADVSGSARAPRGRLEVRLSGGALDGLAAVDADLALSAGAGSTEAEGRASVGGAPAAALRGSVGLPVERLGDRRRLAAAPLAAELAVPRLDLARLGGNLPLAGEAEGRLAIAGSLGAPRAELSLAGRRLEVRGRPLGDLEASGRAGPAGLHARAGLAVAAGGRVDASLDSDAVPSLGALERGELARAPARATLVAERADLGFLPALAPGVVRTASGRLDARIAAAGPLSRLRPEGTLRVAGGSAAVSEYGEWHGVEIDGEMTEGGIALRRLEARRRGGRLSGWLEVRGRPAPGKPAALAGELHLERLAIPHAGQDLATLDFDARVDGKVGEEALEARVEVSRGSAQLPRSLPRRVQSLDSRPDVAVAGRAGPRKEAGGAPVYRTTVHVEVPTRFEVKSDFPIIRLELKGDATLETDAGGLVASGRIETLGGQVEPFLPGRSFDVKRGVLRFTDSDFDAAQIDAVLFYDNPAARVTVTLLGTVKAPQLKMTSDPPMDESQIALFLYTGRTELKAGTGGVQMRSGEEAGATALGMIATQALRNVVSTQLPVDVVVSSTQARGGVYLTDRIYVGYVHRFNANVFEGENLNEVRVEYQISPRWTFESTYGDSSTGSASLVWTKDY